MERWMDGGMEKWRNERNWMESWSEGLGWGKEERTEGRMDGWMDGRVEEIVGSCSSLQNERQTELESRSTERRRQSGGPANESGGAPCLQSPLQSFYMSESCRQPRSGSDRAPSAEQAGSDCPHRTGSQRPALATPSPSL